MADATRWCCDHRATRPQSKEAVGAALIGAKAPFRLVQDHSRSGRLEAAIPALRKWLLSDAFSWCATTIRKCLVSRPTYRSCPPSA